MLSSPFTIFVWTDIVSHPMGAFTYGTTLIMMKTIVGFLSGTKTPSSMLVRQTPLFKLATTLALPSF